MTIQISIDTNAELLIKGDEHVLAKLPEGFDASTFELTDERVDAQSVARAFNDAECKGEQAIMKYAAIRQAFVQQQALITIEANKPKESHAPAITTPAMKPVDA